MADKFLGKWQNYENSKLDDYFKAMDVNFAIRKLACVQKPLMEIQESGGTFTVRNKTSVKTSELKFKLGEEFDDADITGKKAKSVFFMDGDKLVKEMTVGSLKTTQSREIQDGIMVVKMEVKNVTAVMKFKKVE